jgi:hypothetical protein
MMVTVAAGVVVWLILAYIVLPTLWTHHERQPGLADKPMVTRTSQGIPGDPINVGLVGEHAEVVRAMAEAGWFPADPVTLKSSIEIVGSVMLDRPYRHAPVSPLFYEGRREDLAFEKPAGKSADHRHHVRFWRTLDKGAEGRPVWLGSATYDRSVGISHYTGAVTHHIAPDIDDERILILDDLMRALLVEASYRVTGIGPTLNGRNGGGDRYFTDGEVWIARLTEGARKSDTPPQMLASPPLVAWKDSVWNSAKSALGE